MRPVVIFLFFFLLLLLFVPLSCDNGDDWSFPPLEDHRASFLFDNGATRVMNILSPNCSEDVFRGIVARCKQNGDNVIYLYLINEGDGPWTPYSFYVNNDIGGAIDAEILSLMKARCEYILSQKWELFFGSVLMTLLILMLHQWVNKKFTNNM